MSEIIKVTESSYVVRRQILVVEVPFIMKKDEIELLRNRITDQMKSGLVILPPEVRAITCDTDTVMIKGDCNA
jgi:hypothetical protein